LRLKRERNAHLDVVRKMTTIRFKKRSNVERRQAGATMWLMASEVVYTAVGREGKILRLHFPVKREYVARERCRHTTTASWVRS